MKKLVQGSIALLLFSISIMIFEMACKKDSYGLPTAADAAAANAAISTQLTQAGQLLYQTANGGIGIENYDGTNQTPLNLILPANSSTYWNEPPSISPDHKTIFFAVINQSTFALIGGYACNIDGTNVRKIDNSAYHIAF